LPLTLLLQINATQPWKYGQLVLVHCWAIKSLNVLMLLIEYLLSMNIEFWWHLFPSCEQIQFILPANIAVQQCNRLLNYSHALFQQEVICHLSGSVFFPDQFSTQFIPLMGQLWKPFAYITQTHRTYMMGHSECVFIMYLQCTDQQCTD
jgi:hypothetical protein